jgi:Flp pilus assembly protein protease CpaA
MIDYFFIFGIVIIGLITSYTDFKFGKIRNKIIVLGLIYAIILNIINITILKNVNLNAYSDYIVNSILIFVFGFIFWNIGLWTAGDAKLFFIFNLLTPPHFITKYYLDYFYGFLYFINIFGLMFIFLVIRAIKNITKREFDICVKKSFDIKQLKSLLIFIFAFGFIMNLFPDIIKSNFFITIMFFFVIYTMIEPLLSKKKIYFILIMGSLCIIRIITSWNQIITINFWINFFGQLITLIILRFLILRISYYAFTKKIKITNLEIGQFLAEDIIPANIIELDENRKKLLEKEGKVEVKYIKKQIENLTLLEYLKNSTFKYIKYNKNIGITKEDLEWFNENKNDFMFKSIRVYDTMPFAPLIFIGVLGTIISKGNFFVIIRDFLFK